MLLRASGGKISERGAIENIQALHVGALRLLRVSGSEI